MRHQRRGLETLTTNSWAMLYGTLVMGAIALVRGDDFTPSGRCYMGALLYLALFGSVIAFGAFYAGWADRRRQSRLQYPAVPAGGPDDFDVLRRLRLAQQRGYRAGADSGGNW
jgi:hypothetical protein